MIFNIVVLNEFVYLFRFRLRRIKSWAVSTAKCVVSWRISIKRNIFSKLDELREVAACIAIAGSLQSHILIINAHFNIVIRSCNVLPQFKYDLRSKWRVRVEGMLECCWHCDSWIVMIWVEEKFQDLIVWNLILVLVDPCLKFFNSPSDHAIDEQSSCGLVSCKSFVIEITVKHHHFIEKCLICERSHWEYLIEISCPNWISILRCLVATKRCWVLLHQNCHIVDDLLMRISLLLEDNWVVSASILFKLGQRAVCLWLIFIIIEVLDMKRKRLEIVRKRLLSKFCISLIYNWRIDLKQR